MRKNKKPLIPKFDEKDRTFKTRIEFIRNIFSHRYSESDILASGINYKLTKSYENYENELEESMEKLLKMDLAKVLKGLQEN